jgi:hypothetical protein
LNAERVRVEVFSKVSAMVVSYIQAAQHPAGCPAETG